MTQMLRAPLDRRSFLRRGVAGAVGVAATAIAACAPGGGAGWTFRPGSAAPASSVLPTALATALPSATPVASHGDGPTPAPSAGHGSDHDAAAKAVVDRFLGGEWQKVPGLGNQPLGSRVSGSAKAFDLTIDHIQHRIDAEKQPLEALGFNGTWPGPRLEVVEGDLIRATFTNNLRETTGIHFHGQDVPNGMDGVPHITQDPIPANGGRFIYEFRATPAGSHMYHSHHNATDQVGRGLLGAFIVQPADVTQRYDRLYGATQDIVWISNDAFGGFTINGRGFPATQPILAERGETIVIRFMNEGVMMHPWHLHGMPMRIVARDGYPLGAAAFTCDTLGVNPGERWDAVIECRSPGAWAFHCHILPHAEGRDGMFGMVTALIVR
jgi:FtsP/CotA-like multicopper oxidase with cupredoxin domain